MTTEGEMTFKTKIGIKFHQALGWADFYALHIAIGVVMLALIMFMATVAALNLIY